MEREQNLWKQRAGAKPQGAEHPRGWLGWIFHSGHMSGKGTEAERCGTVPSVGSTAGEGKAHNTVLLRAPAPRRPQPHADGQWKNHSAHRRISSIFHPFPHVKREQGGCGGREAGNLPETLSYKQAAQRAGPKRLVPRRPRGHTRAPGQPTQMLGGAEMAHTARSPRATPMNGRHSHPAILIVPSVLPRNGRAPAGSPPAAPTPAQGTPCACVCVCAHACAHTGTQRRG